MVDDKSINVPLLSISCITYNHVNYIRQALDGFLMQKTSFPFEIIIHDDASNDVNDASNDAYDDGKTSRSSRRSS